MISKAQENEIIRLRKDGATYREIKFVQGLNTYNPILRVLQEQGMTRASYTQQSITRTNR